MKDDFSPPRMVFERIREIRKVIRTEKMRTPKRTAPDKNAEPPAINAPITAMRPPNLPLQGMKVLVRMAMSFSRFEAMIAEPVTPTQLQPSPMHMNKEI